jgi:hypothetical protein
MDNSAGRPIVEFFIITFCLRYGAQIVCNILSKSFDDFSKNSPGSSSSERSNFTKSRKYEDRIRNLEIEVTTKERIIEEEKVKFNLVIRKAKLVHWFKR